MGLFREAGRQVEQLKRSVTAAADEGDDGGDEAVDANDGGDGDANYECEDCGARFDTHDGECPECWSTELSQLAE